jgi:CrcB protein
VALTTGVMGGFTTYSTFNYESIAFFQRSAWLFGTLNIVVTVVVCLVAGGLGLGLARLVAGP